MESYELNQNNLAPDPSIAANPLQNPQQTATPPPNPPFPGKNNYSLHKKIFLVVVILLVIVTLGALSMRVMHQNATSTNQQSSLPSQSTNNPTTVPTKSTTSQKQASSSTISTDVTWVDYLDNKRGSSFKHPDSWEVIEATSGDYIEYEIRHPDKVAYVLITVYPTGKVTNESDIKAAILSKEKDLRSDEKNNVIEFTSSMNGNTGSYTSLGEEMFFNFAEDETSTSSAFKFQEKGLYKLGEKSVVLHGASLPGEKNEDIVTQIIESFKPK